MEVIIDGHRNFALQGEPESVIEVLSAITEHLRAQQRGMLCLKVDGEAVQPSQVQGQLETRSVESVQTVEVTSEELHTLVNGVLSSLNQVLPELPKACRDLAKVFHGESPEDGYEPFHQLAQIWSHIKTQEGLVLEALEIRLDSLDINGRSAQKMHLELNQFLGEAADALRQGDTILLGDLLEYELAPRAEHELALVALLQERSAAKSG